MPVRGADRVGVSNVLDAVGQAIELWAADGRQARRQDMAVDPLESLQGLDPCVVVVAITTIDKHGETCARHCAVHYSHLDIRTPRHPYLSHGETNIYIWWDEVLSENETSV